jgi:hypothetical protein
MGESEAFEAWAREFFGDFSVELNDLGHYRAVDARLTWLAWQARASLAERDAARYRWLRAEGMFPACAILNDYNAASSEWIDAKIDAAMATSPDSTQTPAASLPKT